MDKPKFGETKATSTSNKAVTAALIAAVALLSGYEVTDLATADAQADKIVVEYVAEKTIPFDSVAKNDSVVIAKDGRKCILPAEDVFRPNIIIDSTYVLTVIIRDEVTGKIWHKATIRATDSTGRLDFNFRIQPCSKDILNADTIHDTKE